MAWYAQIGTDSKVQQVIYVADVYDMDWVVRTYGGVWIETADDGSVQKNFPCTGFTYDVANNEFIPPQPFSSWVLDTHTYTWKAPVPYPTDGKNYKWSESAQNWVEIYAGNS